VQGQAVNGGGDKNRHVFGNFQVFHVKMKAEKKQRGKTKGGGAVCGLQGGKRAKQTAIFEGESKWNGEAPTSRELLGHGKPIERADLC